MPDRVCTQSANSWIFDLFNKQRYVRKAVIDRQILTQTVLIAFFSLIWIYNRKMPFLSVFDPRSSTASRFRLSSILHDDKQEVKSLVCHVSVGLLDEMQWLIFIVRLRSSKHERIL